MEPIKQEIINNIFENGDKLITGPILQTVLIDMIDDVNGKDQEILSKTGSWDNAVTQIPNLATKEEVTNLSESVARDLENVVDVDLTGYATEQWVESQGYLKEHQDISNLATKTELTEAKNNLQGNITSLSESVARDIANVDVDLTGYATEQWVQSQDYASKTYVNDAVSSSSVDLTGYATETWVQNQGYLTEHQDISGLATKTELTEAKNNLQGNITSLSESVARDIANVDVDLTGYATEQWVQNQGYLTEHQDISNLATKTELNDTKNILQSDMVTLSGSMAKSIEDSAIAIGTEIQNKDYASKTYVNNAVAGINLSDYATKTELTSVSESVQTDITNLSESVARDLANVDLTGYATEQWVQNQGYLKEHQDISGLATKTELTSVSESVQTDITNLSESVANSAVWKKGTGTDSIAQVIADGTNLPTAAGERAIATGYGTNASGHYSHAEGQSTTAEGWNSHAEGFWTEAPGNDSHAEGETTKASGAASHAEGKSTIASNQYEHAQGQYNHTSTNQIFSVGAGENVKGTVTRRNAVSILAVPNSDTQINTASVFVQNIGGYDGTNPTPGTNDLATVINGMSTGGGSSETLWKKGTGQDSLVQKLTGNNEANTSVASGTGAVAIGSQTTASVDYSHAEGLGTVAKGNYSHAEGFITKASGESSHAEGYGAMATGYSSHAEGYGAMATGWSSHAEGRDTIALKDYSHAEGYSTNASGEFSHAEGGYTVTSNEYEHAQGQYNHSSTNQIFSVGAGENANGTETRRNAVSILAVPNSETHILTASFFVQNVGGYDGTNPTPGTNDLATVISGLSSGGGSSETLWKKGTGTDSIVQKVTNITLTEPIASGMGAAAIGDKTKASGWSSHAEGYWTEAKGNRSHAEGYRTEASGEGSHAEGYFTITSNNYEHAQGKYNHSSENQIFSVGAGDGGPSNPELATRRNAISVLAVPNSETQVVTASFFVQNVGGYDGTNPTPGTNDLATVINNLPSGGGSSETLWKKGTGKNSIVQVIGGMPLFQSRATGDKAIATGFNTNASGESSHAEGNSTEASGLDSHAEGAGTIAANEYEHAQGRYNHNSENQIFSIGTGNSGTDRRNAVSVLEVSNNNSYTGSFFVQNIGGYDGTNPLPGTNDLATVINGMAIEGGIGTSSETWTFTLDDGSTVTKNIVMR